MLNFGGTTLGMNNITSLTRFQTFVSASYGEMERSSRDLDKFVNEIPHEIIIPLTIPRLYTSLQPFTPLGICGMVIVIVTS